MIETFTQTENETATNVNKIIEDRLASEFLESEYYSSIKSDLDLLIKNPSDKIINRLLDFSKSF